MTRNQLKETLKNIMQEESAYADFFKKALEKAGKSIPDMSDEEKKEFFNKIDAAWDGKGEKNEELTGNQHKLDIDGDGEIEASDLAALRAGEKKEESVNEASMDWETHFKGFNEKELKVIQKFISMNPKGIDGVIQMSKNKDFKPFIQKAAKSGLGESVNEASYVSGYTVKAKTPYEFVNGAYAVLSAYLRDEELGPKGKKELQNILKSLEYMRKYFFFKLSESVNEIKKGSVVIPYAMDKHGEFIVDKVFKNKSGETSYTGKFKKSGESKEFILHSKDKVVKESVNEAIAVGKMVKVVDNPHWEAALGKKGPFKRKVKAIYDDNVFFTDGSNSSMKYVKESTQSVNEAASRTAMEIGGLTGLNKDAVQKFVDTHNMDIEKVYQYVKKSKLTDRLNFVTAIVGTPGNPVQKRMIKMFGESVNELKKLPSGNFSIKKRYNTFTDYEKNAKTGDAILLYDKRGESYTFKTLVNGNELHKNAEKYLDKVNGIIGGVVFLTKKGMKGVAQVPDYEKKELGVLVLESKSVNEGRAFINAARKAKQEGKTEFEFNGKKYPVTLKEGTLNEMNPQLNKGVKSLLDKELKDLRKGGSNHLFAVMTVLMGALTDANFHSESKKVPAIFGSKAKYEGDPMAQKDMESLYQSIGERIATMAKWDGEDIAKAVGFYVSMTIGRPLGQKIENLV